MRSIWRFPLVRIVLAAVSVILVVAGVQSFIVTLRTVGSLSDPLFAIVYYLLYLLASVMAVVVTYGLYVRVIEQRAVTELGLHGAVSEWGVGMLIGGGLFTLVIGSLWWLGVYRVTGLNAWLTVLGPLVSAVAGGFVEEVLLRGIVFRITEEALGTWVALVLSAVLFGLLHITNPGATWLSAIAIALEAGILLAAAYLLTRRLWLAIGIHSAWNFMQGGIFGVAVSGNTSQGLLQSSLTGPVWLSGGAFGVEASVVTVVVCLTAGIILLLRAKRLGRYMPPPWRSTRPSAVPIQ